MDAPELQKGDHLYWVQFFNRRSCINTSHFRFDDILIFSRHLRNIHAGMTAYCVRLSNAKKNSGPHHYISCEDRRARSKAMDLGSIPVGVRRFESGSSHQFFWVSGIVNILNSFLRRFETVPPRICLLDYG